MVKHELRVESLKARVEIQKCNFKLTSYEFKSTSYEFNIAGGSGSEELMECDS